MKLNIETEKHPAVNEYAVTSALSDLACGYIKAHSVPQRIYPVPEHTSLEDFQKKVLQGDYGEYSAYLPNGVFAKITYLS